MTIQNTYSSTTNQTNSAVVIQSCWRGFLVRKSILKPRDIDLSSVNEMLVVSEYETALMICRIINQMKHEGRNAFFREESLGCLTVLTEQKEQMNICKEIKIKRPLVIEVEKTKSAVYLHVINHKNYLGGGTFKKVYASHTLAIVGGQCHVEESATACLKKKNNHTNMETTVGIEKFLFHNFYNRGIFNFPSYIPFADCQKPNLIVQKRFKCDLKEYLEFNKYSLSNKKIYRIFYEIFHFLEFIHANGVLHNDIKSRNIFCNQEEKTGPFLYIGDWDAARDRSTYSKMNVTYAYWNLARRKGYITKTADIYGAVIAMSECVFGDVFREYIVNPYELLDPKKQIAFLTSILIPSAQSTTYYIEYERELLSKDPEKRISEKFEGLHLYLNTFTLLISLLEKDLALFNWLEEDPQHKELLQSDDQEKREAFDKEIESRYLSATDIKKFLKDGFNGKKEQRPL